MSCMPVSAIAPTESDSWNGIAYSPVRDQENVAYGRASPPAFALYLWIQAAFEFLNVRLNVPNRRSNWVMSRGAANMSLRCDSYETGRITPSVWRQVSCHGSG